MGLRVYREVCGGKHGLKQSSNWYEETPDPVRKSADGRGLVGSEGEYPNSI